MVNSESTRLGHYTLLLFLISACLGSFFFVKGFLKVKDYLPNRADTRFSPLEAALGNTSEVQRYILTHQNRSPLYQQVVWLIIDMMPIYMVKPNPGTKLNYENIMGNVKARLDESSEKSAVYVFLSEEPTMTNSRVEAMGTGSHTSYVKIATGFQNSFAEEDNFIEQIAVNNLSSVHVGDSLWTQLFPKSLYVRSFSESAYSEVPLSELIRIHINEECRRKDWSFMIVHGNELDHNLHIYGWTDPKVIRNIHEADEDIEKVVSLMQPNSLVLAFGDHGATRTARHGGGTKEEIESGMFAYSGKKFTFRSFLYPEHLPERVRSLLLTLGKHVNHTFLNREAFPQIDAVPTMSAALNIPIPFSNLGVVIPEILHYDNCGVAGCLYELFMEHVLNFAQVLKYVKAFVKHNPALKDQETKMQGAMGQMQAKISGIMRRADKILKAEEAYIANATERMGAEMETKYAALVDNMFSVMIQVREELGQNSEVFKHQWSSMNWLLMYSNLVIRILVSAMIGCGIVLVYVAIKNDIPDLFTSVVTSVYPMLGCLVLFLAVLLYQFLVDIVLVATYAITFAGLSLLAKIVAKYHHDIRDIVRNEAYIMPTILGLFLIAIQSLGFSAHAMSQHYVLPYITHTGIACFLFVVACRRPDLRVFVGAVLLAVLARFAIAFGETKIDTNYWLCSAIPAAVFLVGAVYYAYRAVHPGVNKLARSVIVAGFVLCFGGMMHYQVGEVTGTYKQNYFIYIILPRTIFVLTGLQAGFLLVTLHWRKLLWTQEPTKSRRIYAFFLFMTMAILPALLMMVGPYQQIYYLMIYLMARLLNYCMERVGLENSFFQYAVYTLIMQSMFFSTGHVLDFMALRIQRAFVGFPEFSTATNFTLAFFETVGVFSFTLVILPMLSSEFRNQGGNGGEMEPDTPGRLNTEGKVSPMELQEQGKMDLIAMKNYLTVLLHFEMVHNGLTRFLVVNFSGMFFMVSPVEFTFRFIDWYIYILVLIYAYILGSV